MSGHTQDVYVARQPIFRKDGSTWGYELLFRGSGDAQTAAIVDDTRATLQVITDGFLIGSADIDPGKHLLVNFPQELLEDDSALALPASMCVVEVLETVRPTAEVLEGLARLKAEGYTLALDDYAREEELTPFMAHVDIVKADIMQTGTDPDMLRQLADEIRAQGCIPLAEKVEDHDSFGKCFKAGFELFQGFFFSKPVVIPGRKLSSSQTTRLQLLHKLGAPDLDPEELTNILQSDPSLSYRLLQTINSAGYGLRNKVDTVRRAINFLGVRHIALWLRAVLLSDIGGSREAEQLAFLSVHRARFLESIADEGLCSENGETMFMLGLFSLLDALLGMEMEDVLAPMPLSDEIKCALTGRDCPLSKMLELVRCLERGTRADCAADVESICSNTDALNRLYTEAMVWTGKALGTGESG